jgi:uncharacterized protein YcbX
MTKVGTIGQIWRYPVKSMQGERLDAATVGANGLPGDRAWAVRDEVRGGIRGAKKIPALMQCAARYPQPIDGSPVGPAEIELPDGSRFLSTSPDAAARLSAALDHEVTLWPLLPADALDHYRRGQPDHQDLETELRAIFGRQPDEPLPDLASFPPEILEFESPPGTYFDAFPLLVLTSASLRRLHSLVPDAAIDVRRFRPNLVVDTPEGVEGFVEPAWAGRRIRIGDVELEATVACPRCVMITHPVAELPKDAAILRTVVREADQNLGVYARVTRGGAVEAGAAVEID